MKRVELDTLLHLDGVIKHSAQRITVIETSAANGAGLQSVMKWLQQNAKT